MGNDAVLYLRTLIHDYNEVIECITSAGSEPKEPWVRASTRVGRTGQFGSKGRKCPFHG